MKLAFAQLINIRFGFMIAPMAACRYSGINLNMAEVLWIFFFAICKLAGCRQAAWLFGGNGISEMSDGDPNIRERISSCICHGHYKRTTRSPFLSFAVNP